MTIRTLAPDLQVYADDHGPERFSVLVAGDPRPFPETPFVWVALRRTPGTEADRDALIDALDEATVREFYARRLAERERWEAAHRAWARTSESRSASPEPEMPPLPEWPMGGGE